MGRMWVMEEMGVKNVSEATMRKPYNHTITSVPQHISTSAHQHIN